MIYYDKNPDCKCTTFDEDGNCLTHICTNPNYYPDRPLAKDYYYAAAGFAAVAIGGLVLALTSEDACSL